MEENSRWSDIFLHLKSKGYDVYSPSTKEGECTSPYIVVKSAGVSKALNFSSSVALYDIMLYMPKNMYSKIEPYMRQLKEDMDGLWPMIRPVHFETTPYYDDSVKGWMVSVQYRNYQKNKRP